MKSLYFLVAVLAALALCSEAASVQDRAVAVRSNLYLGAVKPGDKRIFRDYYYKAPKANYIQYMWIWYSSKDVKYSVIYVTEVGPTQWATPAITEGGIGSNNVTIQLTSAAGRGFYYLVEIWGQ